MIHRAMRRGSFAGAFFLLAWGVLVGGGNEVHASPTVEVMATDPPGSSVVLGRNENFFLLLQYHSDQPVRIWVQPYFRGKPVNAGSNPSRIYPAGSGEAFGWFFLFQPDAEVDEVRIRAGDGSTRGTAVVANYPVRITGSAVAKERAAADWVTRLNALEAKAQQADHEQRMSTPISDEDTVLFSGFLLTVLGLGLAGFAAPVWGLWKWRGAWRVAAALPAVMMAFVVLRIVIDGLKDPTSHNLWPFEILLAGILSTGFIILAGLIRQVFRTRGQA